MDFIIEQFEQLGGLFPLGSESMAKKLNGIKAFVFDWDGVFNNAAKNEQKSSNFNEADSMGTNMLRFSYYLQNQQLPYTAIISGEKNSMAFYFCEREHFDGCYYKIPDKMVALNHFCEKNKIQASEVCYVFDDVLDLSIAQVAGIRIMIHRKANPLYRNYIIKRGLADYITGSESGNFAVRESCELLMGLFGNYDTCLDERKDFSAIYQEYLGKRQSATIHFHTQKEGVIITESL